MKMRWKEAKERVGNAYHDYGRYTVYPRFKKLKSFQTVRCASKSVSLVVSSHDDRALVSDDHSTQASSQHSNRYILE